MYTLSLVVPVYLSTYLVRGKDVPQMFRPLRCTTLYVGPYDFLLTLL